MADEVNAGAILIELRAQVEGVKKGFAEVKSTLNTFASGVRSTAAVVQGAGQQMTQSFDRMERSQARLAARTALMVSRLLTLQLVIQNIGTRFAGSRFSKEIQVASDALTSFGAIVSVFPNKAGLIVGAIAAISTVIANLTGQSEEAKKEVQGLFAALEDIQKARVAIDKTGDRSRKEFDMRGKLSGWSNTDDNPEERMQQFRAEQRELMLQKILNLNEEMDQRTGQLAPHLRVEDELLIKLQEQVEKLQDDVVELNKAIAQGEIDKQMREARAEVAAFNAEIKRGQTNLELFFRHGLLDPLDKLRGEAALAEKELHGLLDLQAKMETARPGSGGELGTQIGDSLQKTKAKRAMADRGLEVDRMAQNLSGAIGEGIVDGILAGRSAMETLANVGRNLFENMIRDVVGGFQTLMTDAFKAITGVAGVEIGGLLTGIMGVVGMFLSQRGKDGSDAFSSVKSNIESSQAVRGIVAGPASVSIASVGENLSRAVAPLVELARASLDQLKQISAKLGSGGAPGGGYAGRVSTT